MKRRTQVAISAILALGGIYLLADAFDLTPGILTTRPIVATAEAYPTVQARSETQAILPEFDSDAQIPDAAAVQSAIEAFQADDQVTGGSSIEFVDTATGDVLGSSNADVARTPASNTKLATAVVALEKLGPATTFPTTTTLSGSTLYLVGGGDTLLASGAGDETAIKGRAGIGDLAEATAAKLSEQGVSEVSVAVDSSLFSGSLYSSEVTGVDTGYIMEMRPLAIMQSRNANNQYTSNPDLQAGQALVDALVDLGISATLDGRATSPSDASELASVQSASVRELVDFMLTDSDNTTADVLGHLASIATGGEGTFESAGAQTVVSLADLGYDVAGVSLVDNSGLSISNKLTTTILVQVFDNLYTCDGCNLEAIASGVPVMGLNGTLSDRSIGTVIAGKVHAKTGTLVTANALSGYLLTANGRLLTFSILVDGIEEGTTGLVRPVMDELLTTVAGL